jgi:hypothetical protein
VLADLPWADWQPTKDTLHLYAQIVGKIKLAVSPPRNHWWNVALLPSARGLTTGALRSGDLTFELRFDFVEHALVLDTSDGASEPIALRDGLPVAELDAAVHRALRGKGIDVEIDEHPFSTPVSGIPFPEDRVHASYDPEAVERFWRVNDWAAGVLEEFAGWYCGKQSPVHMFWHSFDLALTRFSGRRGPPLPDADGVTREAYSHELISFGFWAGDAQVREATFYSYTSPEPGGITEQPLTPAEARWSDSPNGGHLAVLPYDVVRAATDPRALLLGFLESGYRAGTRAGGWDAGALQSSFCPPQDRLAELLLPGV